MKSIEVEAAEELLAEMRREKIDAHKDRIRARRLRPWGYAIIPFTITINWRA